jgi:hypothetical protein
MQSMTRGGVETCMAVLLSPLLRRRVYDQTSGYTNELRVAFIVKKIRQVCDGTGLLARMTIANDLLAGR